ncbi:MAG TPA: L,D-transpeptidase family protein [Phycisphaerae bacterium]|nr:L,D-transpeptidase family protein [Phycisphaerae bacterium]
MTSHSNPNQKPVGVVITVVIVAACAWGIYAWKYTETPAVVSADADKNAASQETSTNDERPAPIDSAVPDLGSSMRANAPVSVDDDMSEAAPVTTPTLQPAAALDRPADNDAANMSPAPAEFGDNAARALKTGRDALASSEVVKARAALSRALALGVQDSDQEFIRRELEEISQNLVFGRAASPGDPLVTMHTVKSGENLFAIAATYKISEDFILTLNGHKDRDMLWAGMKLKVVRGPFSAKIYKAAHRMDIYLGDVYVRSFPVGLGTDSGTPTGDWIIQKKIPNPDWSDPTSGRYYAANDAENPIGEHWISLECVSGECMGRIGFGIHGTIDPQSIGADRSMGCVRMSADDVALVYNLLVHKHSRVTILP